MRFAHALVLAAMIAAPPSVAPRFHVAGLDSGVLARALEGYQHAVDDQRVERKLVTIFVYDTATTEKRLWVIDPDDGHVLFHELVAHGKGSGELYARKFGNGSETHESSVGAFRTAETYQGKHGYSLRLDGLEPGVNDRARERDIVIHGAAYATPEFAAAHGRLGRSFGCPALDPRVARAVIDAIKDGSFVFVWGEDEPNPTTSSAK